MLNFGRLLITDNKNYPKTKSGYVKIYTSTGEVGSTSVLLYWLIISLIMTSNIRIAQQYSFPLFFW